MRILTDGHSTTITFSLNPAIKFKEKTVTPPGLQGGGANDTTTMRNVLMRTRKPKKLITMSDGSCTVAYDPAVLPQILAMINKNQLITVTYPDTDGEQFWGWLDEFTKNENVEGEQPTANVVFIPSNEDNLGNEVQPVHIPGPGP